MISPEEVKVMKEKFPNLSEMEIAALRDKFTGLSEDEQRIAISCFDLKIMYEELFISHTEDKEFRANVKLMAGGLL